MQGTDQSPGFPGDDQFLIGGNDKDARGGSVDGEVSLRREVAGVAGRSEPNAEVIQIAADPGPQPGVVFPDSTGEDEGVAAVELDKKGTDPMTDLLDKDINGELCAIVPLDGRLADVAQIIAHSRKAEQATLAGKLGLGLLEREIEMTDGKGKRSRIEITHPIVMGKTGLRTEAEAAADGSSIADPCDGTAPSEVTRYHPDVRRNADRRAVQIKAPGGLRQVVAPQELGRSFCHELVARAVEAVATHARLQPGPGDRVVADRFGSPLVEGRLKESDEGKPRRPGPELADPGRIGRVMGRSDVPVLVERREDPMADFTRDFSARDDFRFLEVATASRSSRAWRLAMWW